MRAYDVIKRKRDGEKLTQEEIQFIINGFVRGNLPDYQMSAFLMAVVLKDMDEEETFWLTDTMRLSGDLIDLKGITGTTVDKHSTGGVGDKTSLVLGPLLAALGLRVAKLSGRGLGHTGGTIDKLEAIKGFSCDLSAKNFVEAVNQVGVAIIGQTGNLVPADKKIYALRDVTATIDSIPLIAASIMSKKLAVANKVLLLDVKVGSGAFMKKLSQAKKLAELMVRIGQQAGRKVVAVLSNMDEPLGVMIGNALEVREAIDTLKGRGPADFTQLVKTLALQALLITEDKEVTKQIASSRIEEAITSGKAFEKFVQMVKAQGGDVKMVENPSLLPTAKEIIPLRTETSGYISRIDCEEVGLSAMMLGAGRETKESVIDMSVGLELLKHVGDKVEKGGILANLHVNPAKDNTKAIDRLMTAFHITAKKVKHLPLVIEIVS